MMKNYVKDYPRPQLIREGWENLNGEWQFAFDDADLGEKDKWFVKFPAGKTIRVPFTYETEMSGIGDETRHDRVWYRRNITVKKETGRRVLLHFEGSDYLTKVWVNGQLAGSHRGGYARFSIDVTQLVNEGENTLTVEAEDSFDNAQPRGKQRWKDENFGCWYIQTTGIWKTVWMESVPEDAICGLKLTPFVEQDCLDVEAEVDSERYGAALTLEAEVTFDGIFVSRVSVPVTGKRVSARINVYNETVTEWGVKTWSPENPDLYDVTFRLYRNGERKDEVKSYFGMREVRISGDKVLLNGAPLYQRLILDQGYWKESHLTPPSEEALITDIDRIMELGYNGLRKHQKTEDERFLYWCDVKGMLVWSEVPASYTFSDDAVQDFTEEWMEIVRQNYNHPAIITWTPFNESWGVNRIETNEKQQHFTEAIYYLTKAFDGMRPVITNDGWEHTISDILTLHDYEEYGKLFEARYTENKEGILEGTVYHNGFKGAFAKGYGYKGQPVIISEYGGIAFDNEQTGWGYGNKVESEEDFIKRFADITYAIKKVPYICGYCYTQVSDVQQEINGLMDAERNFKVSAEAIREINEKPVEMLRSGL